MNLPETVQVGPYTFTVNLVDEITSAAEEIYGLCRLDLLTITLRDGLAADATAENLVHEWLHALWFAARLPEKLEEEIVGRLAPGLLDGLRRNPQLLEYLAEGLRGP